jgi:hypothetical protein
MDRSKVRRERHFVRKNLSYTIQPPNELFGPYFDGKKDKTRVIENKIGINYPRIEIEDHYAIVSEPESKYKGHVSVGNDQSLTIGTNIVQFYKPKTYQRTKLIQFVLMEQWLIQECMVIQSIEEKLNRPLQWLI